MSLSPLQFLFGDRELLVKVQDLLTAPVEVIVNPANSTLIHGGGVAAQILAAAGEELDKQSRQLINEYGQIESGMAVYTHAGNLSYKAVIHAVGPTMGEGEEQRKLEQAIARSLQLCDMNEWVSVAFPAISAGIFRVPIETCAQAFFRSITHFWDARHECAVEKVVICLTETNFRAFVAAFRDDALETTMPTSQVKEETVTEVGEIELNDEDIMNLDDDETNDWFK